MAFLTENQLGNTMDLPVALAVTDLRMGDWLTIATVKVVSPMRLAYRLANLSVISSTVDVSDIAAGNKIYGNLGLVYLTLRKDYVSGSPGAAGGLDVLTATSLGIFSRDTSLGIAITTPGVYSWIIASNMQASTDTSPVIPASTSIDFRITVNGSARLELDASR